MCLIITRSINGTVDWPAADRAARRNPDGYGLAWPTPAGKVAIRKSMRWETIKDKAMSLQKKRLPFILHMRYATHGKVCKDNTHPFRLKSHGLVMAHNGVIHTLDIPTGACDSRVLADEIEATMPKGFLSDPFFRDELEGIAMSSRLSFMDGNGNLFFINEDLGVWKKGVWYSQPGSLKARPVGSWYNPTKWEKESPREGELPFTDSYATRRAAKGAKAVSYGVKTHPDAPRSQGTRPDEKKTGEGFRYTGGGPDKVFRK